MKRVVQISLLVLGVLAISGVVFYYYFLPGYAASIILREDIPGYIPNQYSAKIEEIKKPVAMYSKDVFKIADSLDLSLEFILKVIDDTDSKEIMDVYYLLEHKNITNSEEVYNTIVDNVTFTGFDPDHFKGAFIKFATPGRINRLLRYAEGHEFATSIGPDVSKKIAKQLAIKHYAEREKEIKSLINSN